MNILRRIRCTFSSHAGCTDWQAEEDETIRYLRTEKRSAEEAAARIRRSRIAADPIARVYGGWDRGDRTK